MHNLHDLLRRSADHAPSTLLLAHDGRHLTYGVADEAASRVAWSLRERGIAAGDRVILALPNGPEYLLAYFGILKAGAVVIPTSAEEPAAGLAQIVATSKAKAMFVRSRTRGRAADSAPVLALHDGDAEVAFEALLDAGGNLHLHRPGDALAMVLFTSGSTGAPKGVMLSHANLLANTDAVATYLRLSASDGAALMLPFSYSYGDSVLRTHVAVGGFIAASPTDGSPGDLLDAIERYACTGLPGVAPLLALAAATQEQRPRRLRSLRYVTQAGGPIHPTVIDAVRACFAPAELFLMYGQTEAGPRLTYLPPADLDRKRGSVGRAVPGITLRIAGPGGEELAPGVVGELVARGPSVMLGYLDDPVESGRVLRDGELWTGDAASIDEDGFVYLAGRTREMLKVAGHRVAPQEIADALLSFPEVADSAVLGLADRVLGQTIAAVIVPADPAGDSAALQRSILARCATLLPPHKRPSHVFAVDRLPRNRRGKLDHDALARLAARHQPEPLQVPSP
jgi:long-chain acyl-CoA synthetase